MTCTLSYRCSEQSFTKRLQDWCDAFGIKPYNTTFGRTLRVRLLARTTRNVSVTEAGAQLMNAIRPLFEQIDIELNALSELRDSPRGTIRLSCTDDQIEIYIRPILNNFYKNTLISTIEIYVDYGFTNIVEERFDAGIRIGDDINKDMIAVRIGPDWRLIAVASPDYFKQHPKPYFLTTYLNINASIFAIVLQGLFMRGNLNKMIIQQV